MRPIKYHYLPEITGDFEICLIALLCVVIYEHIMVTAAGGSDLIEDENFQEQQHINNINKSLRKIQILCSDSWDQYWE